MTQIKSDPMRLPKKQAGTLIRTIATLIKFDQVPGIGPAYRAGASLLSLSHKALISLLFCKQLNERLVKAQLAVAQGSPRHPTPYPRQYSLECTQELRRAARYSFFKAIKIHTWCPMCNTEHIFLKLMRRAFFLFQEVLPLVRLTPLLVRLNMGQGDRH